MLQVYALYANSDMPGTLSESLFAFYLFMHQFIMDITLY